MTLGLVSFAVLTTLRTELYWNDSPPVAMQVDLVLLDRGGDDVGGLAAAMIEIQRHDVQPAAFMLAET